MNLEQVSSIRVLFGQRDIKRLLLAFLTLATFGLILFINSCSTSQSTTNLSSNPNSAQSSPFVVRLGFTSADGAKVPMSPEGWAISTGLLKSELQNAGISDVRLINFPNGPDVNESLVSGALDVASYGDVPGIVARSQQPKLRLIQINQVGSNVWLVGAKDKGPKTLAELKGKKVGVRKGSLTHRFLSSLLQETGLEDSVKIVHLLNRDAEGALIRGDIAAYAGSLRLVVEGFPVIDEARNHPKLAGTTVVVTPQDFLLKHPDFPNQWNQIRKKALLAAKANPDKYYQFLADASKFPVPLIKKDYPPESFPEEPFPAQGLELLEKTKKFLIENQIIKSDFKVSDWIATS